MALLAGCTATPRLDARFDTDALGALPSSAPAPTPPNDILTWRTLSIASTVVVDPDGRRWVRALSRPAFIAASDERKIFLLTRSEQYPTNPSTSPSASPSANIRGSLRLRLDYLGTVEIKLRPLQDGATLVFIYGVQLSTFLPPAGGAVHGLQAFNGASLTDTIGLARGVLSRRIRHFLRLTSAALPAN